MGPARKIPLHKRALWDQRGVTLLELVVVIVILSTCIGSLALVYNRVAVDSTRMRFATVATELLIGIMEETIGLGYDVIGDVAPTNFPSPFSEYTYQVQVRCVEEDDLDTPVDPTVTDYKQIKAAVSHPLVGSVQLYRLVARPSS